MLVVIDAHKNQATREIYEDLFLPAMPVAIRFVESCQSQWEDVARTCVPIPAAVRQGFRYMFVRLNRVISSFVNLASSLSATLLLDDASRSLLSVFSIRAGVTLSTATQTLNSSFALMLRILTFP